MQLRLLNFSSLLQSMAAATQAASAQLLDLTIGSVLRAVLEANAAIALWLQWQIARVLANTRAGSSTGEDLDSWMADFGVSRLPARVAAGTVEFARLTPGLAATIPLGALARTADGTQDFAVIADAALPAYNPDTLAYTLPADALAITLPVRAVNAGAAGNVLAGAIGRLATAIPGVDSVANPTPMRGGQDAETDAALRLRFRDFMDTRARATARAVGYAIAGIQQGLSHEIVENTDTMGNPSPGHFLVVVDDGTGTPSAALLDRVSVAIEAVRPIGAGFTVRAPTVLTVDIAISLALEAGASVAAVSAAVGAAIAAHAGGLGVGAPLVRSRIAQLAHDADAAVLNVPGVLLNGLAQDVAPPAHGVIKPGVLVVG